MYLVVKDAEPKKNTLSFLTVYIVLWTGIQATLNKANNSKEVRNAYFLITNPICLSACTVVRTTYTHCSLFRIVQKFLVSKIYFNKRIRESQAVQETPTNVNPFQLLTCRKKCCAWRSIALNVYNRVLWKYLKQF